MDTSGWSTQAHRRHKAGVSASASYRVKVETQTRAMLRGPHLADDGHTLVVPSEWYHEDAARFWHSQLSRCRWRTRCHRPSPSTLSMAANRKHPQLP